VAGKGAHSGRGITGLGERVVYSMRKSRNCQVGGKQRKMFAILRNIQTGSVMRWEPVTEGDGKGMIRYGVGEVQTYPPHPIFPPV